MLRLLTLGGAAIIDDSGAALGAAASQRRTLALLSVLAAAGPVGLSRDKLVALFRPDADPERGRHALTQALYAARRALQCDDLFVVNADIRLNDDRISSDIGDFEATLATDPERAVALYRGPFLDGFYLPGAAEFEQWSSTQRGRLEGLVVRALERLATTARDDGDLRSAADWWNRSAVLRPLDSGVAIQLMEALAAAGDRAGALQYAAVHTSLLRSELDIEPDAAVVELTRSLRERTSGPTVVATAPPLESPRSVLAAAPAVVETAMAHLTGDDVRRPEPPALGARAPTPPVHQAVGLWIPERRRPRLWRLPAVIASAAVLVTIGIGIGRMRQRAPAIRPLALPQSVVVAPFRVAGAAPSLAYLREGMVELLSTRLADDSAARSVDAGAVIGAWHASRLAPAMDVPRDTVVRLAARLGAKRVVVGGIVGTPSRVVVHATVLRVPTGEVASQATVEGSADSIASVVDHLAARLLVAEAGEDERLGNHMSASLSALRAYLGAQSSFRRDDYTAAIRQYETALSRDSTFALAGLRLAIAADRVDDASRVRRGLNVAWNYREELAERDRAMLVGFTGTGYPAPPVAREVVDAWERASDLAPASAEAWFALGARLYHDGSVAAVPLSAERTRVALERALVADTTYAPAARLLAHLEMENDSARTPGATPVVLALHDSLMPLAPFLRWRSAAARGDTAALRAIRGSFLRLGPTNLRSIAMASQFDAVGLSDGVLALATLRGRTSPRARSTDLLLGEHAMALNQGRVADALDATNELRAALPGSHAHLRLRVLDGLYGHGDTAAASAAARELEEMTEAGAGDTTAKSDTRLADACVVAQWRLARGNFATVPSIVAELRAATSGAGLLPVAAGPGACAELLEAGLSVSGRRRDSRTRVARLDSLAFTSAVAGDAATYAPLWIARLHERLGDTRGALAAIRRRQYMSEWPRYLAPMLREESRLADAAGDTAGAAAARRRYVMLRPPGDTP